MRLQSLLGLFFGLQAVAIRSRLPTPGELRAKIASSTASRALVRRDVDPESLYPAHNISVPVDHFHNETRYEPHSNDSFNLAYWYDATYYKPGGPVFVLLGGETFGSDRLPYLQKGIVAQVIKATNGLGVIMEHRYYGTSFPVPNVTTENLRFLSTEQALADVAYFATHAKFEGVDKDLTAPKTPWIVYGGSYAGGQAAFLRVTYPDIFWGTISSSGVTDAINDFWEYFEPIRQFAPPDCVKGTQLLVDVVDKTLLKKNNNAGAAALKGAFGLGDITNNADFANVLSYGIGGWQGTNWDPAVNSPGFFYYCSNLTATTASNETDSVKHTVDKLVAEAGYGNDASVTTVLLNAINYFKEYVADWKASNQTQDEYFSLLNATTWQGTDIDTANAWRSWEYQVCTEWGYFQTGDTPANIMPLVSRTLDLDYMSFPCKAGFNITTPPDTDKVNKYGGFDIEYPRLAIIGGNADPWRPATPLADNARKRKSTTEKPVLEIAHAVHHWEENGLFPNETTPILPPNQIVYAQQFIKDFVIEWLKEFPHGHYEL